MADNTYQRNSVTTSGCTFFDENGVMLRLGFLDDGYTILFGEPKQEGNSRKYPQDQRASLVLTADRASALYYEIIEKKLLPAMESGTEYNGGVFLNRRKDAILELRLQDGDVYLVYHRGIDEDRVAKEAHVFKFMKTEIVENYAPDGSTFEQSKVEGYFMMFCKFLQAGIYDLSNSSAHAYRHANWYTTNKIFKYLEGLAAKLGVVVENRTFQNTSGSGFNSSPSEDSLTPEAIMPVPENTATSLDGLVA